MTVYKVFYYTLSKGKIADGKIGNIKQFESVVYVQCTDTSKVKALIEKYYEKPQNGIYFVPVIRTITFQCGHCIVEPENV